MQVTETQSELLGTWLGRLSDRARVGRQIDGSSDRQLASPARLSLELRNPASGRVALELENQEKRLPRGVAHTCVVCDRAAAAGVADRCEAGGYLR